MTNKKYYWLNDDSRLFLSRGYLGPDETPEERYENIAKHAEKILGISGFAEKFEDYLSRGFYSLSTPVICNFGKNSNLPVSCVTGDTWINTKYGGGKPAKEISIGDEVLTHKGRYKKVTDVIPSKNKGDIYKLKVANRITPLYITGNHLVLTNLGWVRVDELYAPTHLIATIGNLKHVEDDLFYSPIQELVLTDKQEDVYDFTVEEDHSFSAEGVIVHNCFGSYIPDTMEGILDKVSEVGMMTKSGGGTSGYFGHLRPQGAKISSGGESSGPVHFMELFDKVASVVSQGRSRRGSFAAYLDVDHPDINEFLKIQSTGHPIQEMSFGVTITDDWMKSMIGGDAKKRGVWASIIRKRYETGYPYIFFVDNANNQAPEVYKKKGMKIKGGNLCNEISLYQDEQNSFVCVLASLNLLHWDEIKETDAIKTMIYFLDAVNEDFVMKSANIPHLASAHNFAKSQRALGMGVLGWHSYLQSKMVPFESIIAKSLNNSVFKKIQEDATEATKELAQLFGEPSLLKGTGLRNTTLTAIAPTTSSSFILGQVSPSIEPLKDNYFTKDLSKGVFGYKNPFLKALLSKLDKDNNEVWTSILNKGGSVQHLDFLSDNEKDVFKTFGEISQKEVVLQAAQRQKYICQGQSLNTWIHPMTPPKEVSDLLIFAWENGVKGLYYQRSLNPTKSLLRSINECKACEA